MDRQAAGEQADGKQDGDVKHLLRHWPAEALAYIEEIGHNKDGEDRRFGGNETIHSHPPTRGGSPLEFGFECWDCGYTHQNLPLLILPIRIFGMFEVPKRATALNGRN